MQACPWDYDSSDIPHPKKASLFLPPRCPLFAFLPVLGGGRSSECWRLDPPGEIQCPFSRPLLVPGFIERHGLIFECGMWFDNMLV